jgi:hypothetical protein
VKAIDALAAVVVIGGVAGCASSGTMSGAATTHQLHSFQPGWERFFTIDWQAGTERGQHVLSGTVQNRYGAAASRVQLLVEELDDKGAVVSQRVVWLGPTIGPFDTVRFTLPVEPAANYRVTMFAYDQNRGGGSGV